MSPETSRSGATPETRTTADGDYTTIRFQSESYRYLGEDGDGYHHHADLTHQWVLVCRSPCPAPFEDTDHSPEIVPSEVDRLQTDGLDRVGDFVTWIDYVAERRGWRTLRFDVVELPVYAVGTPQGVTVRRGRVPRLDMVESGYLDPAGLDGVFAVLEDRVNTQTVSDDQPIAILWVNWQTRMVEHGIATDSGEHAGVTDADVAHAIEACDEESTGDRATDATGESTRTDIERATGRLRTLSDGDRVRINGRPTCLEVTATPADPDSTDATLELVGDTTTCEIELEAYHVPKHSVLGATCSWLWTEQDDHPEPVTSVEVYS